MTIDYDFVDPPTSVDPARAYLFSDTFESGTVWVRTTLEGFQWQLQPTTFWGEDGVGDDETPIVFNTIQPYAAQTESSHAVSVSGVTIPSQFALELDIAINRTPDSGVSNSTPYCEFYYNVDDGDFSYEALELAFDAAAPSGFGTLLLTYYTDGTNGTDTTTINTGVEVTEHFNATVRVEVGALTVQIYVDDVLAGSATRISQAEEGNIWFFATSVQEYPDAVWRRVTMYGDGNVFYALATDGITVSTEEVSGAVIDLSASEGVTVLQDMQETALVTHTVTSSVAISESVTPSAVMHSIVTDGMRFSMTLPNSVDQYEGWVVNANTFAPSRYENFGFNSFAKIGNTYLGAKQDGIFELTGDDDDGADINASILLGKEDFGTDRLKAMPNAVLGIATDGDMYLRVLHENAPSYTYKLKVSSEEMRNARVDIGRRLALRYWQLEVYNANGADFELESMKMYPVVLSRRTTER